MSAISPPSSPPGNADAKNSNKPFKIRAELLAPTRLALKSQLLLHTRSLSVQVIAHQVLLLVLACTKCYATGSKDPPTIGVVGGGSVGVAVVMTILANGYQADRIALSTRQPDRVPRCEALKAPSALPMFQLVPRYYDNARLARESDVLVLCMPPAQLKSVAIQIRHALAANVKAPPLVISTLCGVTQQSLTKSCGSEAVVRVQPDVEKIASLWYKQQQAEEELVGSLAQISAGLPVNVAELQRHRQPLPLELAAEATAPQREGIRALVKAFALFCRRPWGQNVGVEDVANVLFGDKSEMVLISLGQSVEDTSEEHSQEEEIGRTKTPLVTPSWPLEWEQDLAELQQQLVAHALQ